MLPLAVTENLYQFTHFQDLMCGYYTSSPEKLNWADQAFKKSLNDFSYYGARENIKKHQSDFFCIYTTSSIDDIATKDSDFSCSVGYASSLTSLEDRSVSQYLLSEDSINDLDIFNFTDSRFTSFIKKENSCFLVCDYFGKKKLFYKLVNGVLFFSNEFRTLALIENKNDTLNKQTLRDYLTLGIAIGNSTIINEIKSVPLQGYIEFDGTNLISKPWSFKTTASPEKLSTNDVLSALKSSFLYFTKELGFKYADLTGGADSRLNMAIASSLNADLTYTAFFNPNDTLDYLDEIVVNKLISHHNLNFEHELKGPYKSNSNITKDSFQRHRGFDGDMRYHTLSGMFGGEILGGWSYDNFYSDFAQSSQQKNDDYILNESSQTQWGDTLSSYEHLEKACADLNFSEPQLLYTLYLTYSSSLFYREGNPYWQEPYLLANRKVSIFLSDALLRTLGKHSCTEELRNYSFYKMIYTNHFPEFFKTSFNSEIAAGTHHIRDQINQDQLPKKQGNSKTKNLHEVEKRINLLAGWIESMQYTHIIEDHSIFKQKRYEIEGAR